MARNTPTERPRNLRRTAMLFVMLMLVPLVMSTADAQTSTPSASAAILGSARSVGTFDVSPVAGGSGAGQASGAIVSGLVADARASASGEGVIREFRVASSSSASAEVFSSIDIKDFVATARLQGVGTSSLLLRGERADVSMTDNINSLLVIRASGDAAQEVTLTTGPGVRITPRASTSSVWDVQGDVAGALVLVDASGAASAGSSLVVDAEGRAHAKLREGAQLVFRADTTYRARAGAVAAAEVTAYNEAVVEAVANARLAGEAVTEFTAQGSLLANANLFTNVVAQTEARAEKRVTTQLRATMQARADVTAQGGAVLAYDVDYVDLPARTASQVAVYVDGALSQRVSSASEVRAMAEAGAASYWATTTEGRVLVLASTATRAQAQAVTVAAVPQGFAAASTLARLDAQLGIVSIVEGGFSVLGNLETASSGSGEVIGTFSSFFAAEAEGRAGVEQFTDVRASTQVFASIMFAADARARATAAVVAEAAASAATSARMDTRIDGQLVATAMFHDNVYSTIDARAEQATTVAFNLATDITAQVMSENVVLLEGPHGTVGFLILAKSETSSTTSSRLDTSAVGEVRARLAAGEHVVYRSAADARTRASAELIAKAIASGHFASELNVAARANVLVSAVADHRSDVSARVFAEASRRGELVMDVHSTAKASTMIALTADRATLAAGTASDIVLTVNGEAAARVNTAADVFARARAGLDVNAKAVYFVSTNLQGQTHILAALPEFGAASAARVVAQSKLEADARAKAALDVFGSFRPGYGGVATGDIVSLVAREEAGLILDYTVNARGSADAALGASTKVFDAVKVGSSAFATASAASSNSLRFTNEQSIIEAYDVSSAVMKVRATTETNAAFDLATAVGAEAVSEHVVMLRSSDFVGALIVGRADGGVATASSLDTSVKGVVTAHLAAGTQVIFKAFSGFEAELTDAEKVAQAKAIAQGRLLGQVIVDTQGSATAEERIGWGGKLLAQVTGDVHVNKRATTTANVDYYSDVQAVTTIATANKVEILVDSATSVGKSIIVSLDRETVSGLIRGDAKLLVDGKVVARAASYEDALVPDADKYWLVTTEGEAGLQAIVTLAHFSTRTITIETRDPPSVFMWTSVVLGVVVIAQAAYPRLKRRFS